LKTGLNEKTNLVKRDRSKLVVLEFVVSVFGSKVADEIVEKNGATNMFSSSSSHLGNNLITVGRDM
jgi:ribosomal protein L7Ae-like RNA K-turn-binding protein